MVNEEWFWEVWGAKITALVPSRNFWALPRQEWGVFSLTLICELQKSFSASHFRVRISFKGMPRATHYFLFQYNYFERIHALLLTREIGGSYFTGWWIIHSLSDAENPKGCSGCGLGAHKQQISGSVLIFVLSSMQEFKVSCKLMCELGWFRGVNESPAIMGNISVSFSNYLMKQAD